MKTTQKNLLRLIILILTLALSFGACSRRPVDLEPVTITFVTNVEKITIEPITLDGTTESYMPEDPVRAGYIFAGWFYDEPCIKSFNVEDGISTDITLYAKWQNDRNFNEIEDTVLVESGGFTYNPVGDNYYIEDYNGEKSDITIPASYNAKPVIGISEYAFKNNSVIESINISSVLQSIGEGAFENCKNLKSFNVPGSDYFSSDETGVLYNRDKTSILQVGMAASFSIFVIPKQVNIIRDGAFYGCNFVVNFASDSEYTELNANDFYGFNGRLKIGSNIVDIKQYGFNNFTGTLIFDASCGISEIKPGAFDGYNGNGVVELPQTVTKIARHAFDNCKGTIGIRYTNLTMIEEYAFYNYLGEELIIPSHITNLAEGAFFKSSAKIIFAEGSIISTIPNLAFAQFTGTVYFPSSVINLQKDAFYYLRSSAKIEFANVEEIMNIDPSAFYRSIGNVSFGV